LENTVINITKFPFFKAYQIKDDTGDIWVITDKKLPDQGEKHTFKVRVENIAIFGQQAMGLHLRELSR